MVPVTIPETMSANTACAAMTSSGWMKAKAFEPARSWDARPRMLATDGLS
jgi:hypothetical protein